MKLKENILIIGNGSWGRRLKGKLEKQYELVEMQRFRDEPITGSFDKVYICVPSAYFLEALDKFSHLFSDEVITCTKAYLVNGNSPLTELIKRGYNASHLGGACIEKNEIIRISKDLAFETFSILKNVYAIGFSYWLEKEGINYASRKLISYYNELKELTNNDLDFSDLFATCISKESRNHKFGKSLANSDFKLDIKDGLIEGHYSAKVIQRYNYYPQAKELQDIIYLIDKI